MKLMRVAFVALAFFVGASAIASALPGPIHPFPPGPIPIPTAVPTSPA